MNIVILFGSTSSASADETCSPVVEMSGSCLVGGININWLRQLFLSNLINKLYIQKCINKCIISAQMEKQK